MSRYDSPSAAEHQAQGAPSVRCGVVTVSDTRTLAEAILGSGFCAAGAGAAVVRELAARPDLAVILLTGGTGVAPRDQTPEAVAALYTKELPGFGELFRLLSYQEIGAAAMLSRACAGMIDRTAVFLMPGSTAAVRLAMERLIVPELGHLAKLAAKS